MSLEPDIAYRTVSVQVGTPDGVMFVHVVENEKGFPIQVLINIGKSGSNLAAWADAIARLVTRLLPHIGITGVIEEVSGITSSQLRQRENGEVTRSGPEGLAIALLKYSAEWYRVNQPRSRSGGPSIER